jgi:hypothetical protein
MKALEYPMAVINLSEKEWAHIMSPIQASSLPVSHLSSKFPHAIVYSPLQYQGLRIMHLFMHQGMCHLSKILREGSSSSITGKVIRASTEQLRLELGIDGQVGDWDSTIFSPVATDSWIKSVWQFCSTYDLQLHYPCTKLELGHTNDQFLMMLDYGYHKTDLHRLNEYHMWLQAITVSDITTANGRSITKDSWKGLLNPFGSHAYSWPCSPPTLSSAHWQLWQTALQPSLLIQPLTQGLWLHLPLGSWTCSVSLLWTWYWVTQEDRLYC